MEKRGSGILLHITSLPSLHGVGDTGPGARRFVDFLSEAGQSYWQILPLSPTCTAFGNSPYSSFSAFAGNPLLISPELLVEYGFLSGSDIKGHPEFPLDKVKYKAVIRHKETVLQKAYDKNREALQENHGFILFCNENSDWLDDYALFISFKRNYKNGDWSRWPADIRDRKASAIESWNEKLKEPILKEKFFQYLFYRQWSSLKDYCISKNIQIVGDIPIYVNYDSADVWSNPEIFLLDKKERPFILSGVPPDYFSSTGQIWGHPVYNWKALTKSGYGWWIRRIEHNLQLFHRFRLDHFRGFVDYWEIKAGEKSAVKGRWVSAPAEDFFNTLIKHFPVLPVMAEDLGFITPDVREVMNKFGFPGMKVLLFAFKANFPESQYALHNHVKNCVVYTGTHDNNTVRGWYSRELGSAGRKRLTEYLGHKVSVKTVHWEFVRLAMRSVADTVIIPMQDILGLGQSARMNKPATSRSNWEWRVKEGQLSGSLIKRLSEITRIYGRI